MSCSTFSCISSISSWVGAAPDSPSSALGPGVPSMVGLGSGTALGLKLWTMAFHLSSLMVDMEYSSTKKHSSSVTMSP